jgi:ADP-heptose:LPS heptosyltransferase
VKRILVIRTGAIGDTIVMSVVFQALRKHFPDAWIEVLGAPERIRLINTTGLINQITSLDSLNFSELYVLDGPISPRVSNYIQQFDTILLYSVDPEKIVTTNLCKIYAQPVYQFDPFPPRGENIHITAYLLRTLEGLGVYESGILPEIKFLETESQIPISKTCRFALHPGSGNAKKNWPAVHFAEICTRFIQNYAARILLIGGPAEAHSLQVIQHALPDHAVDVRQNSSLVDLAAELQHCQYYLGNDSGISHLAAATGIPTLVLFGPSNPQVWRPLGKHVIVLAGNGRAYCQGIAVDQVWHEVHTHCRHFS